MVSNKSFIADGSTKTFLSDVIIKSELYCRVYNYIYDVNGVDGSLDATTGLYVRTTNIPDAADTQTLQYWTLVDNYVSFYTAPPSGSTLVVEVATTPEELGDILAGAAADRAELAATNAETSATNSATSATNSANSATASANSATASANSATASATSASASATSATESATEVGYAQEWATTAEDTLVSAAAGGNQTSDYSSLHHANKASASASSASTSATNASASATASSTSATNSANSATASASSATASAASASSAATSETNTAALYDNFDDRYLGAKATTPTLDNDGDALIVGALYFDTSDANPANHKLRVYNGTNWVAGVEAQLVPVPVTLSGNTSGLESTTILVTDSDYNASVTYVPSVSAGSFVDNGDGTYTVTLPDYSVATSVDFQLIAILDTYDTTIATHTMTVTNTVVVAPTFTSQPTTGSESTTVDIVNSTDEADATYVASVDYGSVVESVDGTFTVTLPAFNVAPSNIVTLSVYGTRAGDITSSTTTHQITVQEVTATADTAVTYDLSTLTTNDGYV